MTPAQARAVEWLRERGGDGVMTRMRVFYGGVPVTMQIVLARGDVAPFTPKTWTAVIELGAIETYRFGHGDRVRVAAILKRETVLPPAKRASVS